MSEPSPTVDASEPLARLVQLVEILRDPEMGCPWDQRQTQESVKKHLLEETYEVLDAIERRAAAEVGEELGDLLFTIAFLARLGEEAGEYDLMSICDTIVDKMVQRHPHVFGGETVAHDEVPALWEAQKRKEGKGLLDGIPDALPALAQAQKITAKAAKVGFDWPDAAGVLMKVEEEARELQEAMATKDPAQIKDEFGDLLFSMVNLGRFLGVDCEEALRGTNLKFKNRFAHMERSASESGVSLQNLSLEELDVMWVRAKMFERGQIK